MGTCSSSNKEDKDEKNLVLTPQDVEIIRNSWKLVVKGGLAKYGTTMMIKVFLEHRELKPLWRFARNLDTEEQMSGNDMLKAHGEKLFNAIDMAVNSLDDLNTLVPILIQLGYAHSNWGVKEEHFSIIGEILIGTLQDGLKEEFTPKVKKAWIKAFSVISSQMKIGIKQSESESKSPKNQIQQVEIHVNHVNNDVDLSEKNANTSNNKVFPNGNLDTSLTN